MRLANLEDRAALVSGHERSANAIDIATASAGRFGPDLPSVYAEWDDVAAWAAALDSATSQTAATALDRSRLRAPSPAPWQVFAIGLNYDAHAAESGFATPGQLPPVFPKYVSSFSGPDTTVVLPAGGNVDWEVELVAVISRTTSGVDESQAWSHVAGLTAGQDISERIT